jgi:hypothetical protein
VDTLTQHDLAVAELLPIAKQSEAYAATIDGIEIHDPDQLAQVGDLKKDLNHYRRRLEDKRLSLVGPLKKVAGDIDALFKKPRDKIDAVLATCTRKMNAYVTRQETIEREARQAEAREAAEREERLRKAAETTRAATSNPDDEIAEELERQADVAGADAIAAPAQRQAPVRGNRATVSTTKTWKGEVVDIKAVCGAVAAGRLPAGLVTVSQSDLDGLARALEKETTVDGVRYYQAIGTAVR